MKSHFITNPKVKDIGTVVSHGTAHCPESTSLASFIAANKRETFERISMGFWGRTELHIRPDKTRKYRGSHWATHDKQCVNGEKKTEIHIKEGE
jgi:hypothetical protein